MKEKLPTLQEAKEQKHWSYYMRNLLSVHLETDLPEYDIRKILNWVAEHRHDLLLKP